jgi:RNA polymerase sigma factor (TIGR02999 family)
VPFSTNLFLDRLPEPTDYREVMERPGDITYLLRRAGSGDQAAMERLADRVYADLERIAAGKLRQRYGPGLEALTLEPSALVNETFLKLIQRDIPVADRREFFALATTVMLNVLIDYQRRKSAEKRGGDRLRVTLSRIGGIATADDTYEVTVLSRAFDRLARLNPRHAESLRLKVIWGFTNAEISSIVGASVATVERDLKFARAWLAAELES